MAQAELLTAGHRTRKTRRVRSLSQSAAAPSLKQGFAWLAVGNGVNAACTWGRIAVLAHQNSGGAGNSDVIGQLALAWAICNPISSLFELGLTGALISDARGEFRLPDYVYLRLATGLATLLSIVAMLWAGGYGAGTAALILTAGGVVVIESICEIFQAQTQRCEAMPWVSISLTVRGVLGLGAFAILYAATGNLTLAVAGLAAAASITLFALDIPAALRFSPRIGDIDGLMQSGRPPSLIHLAWLSLPLGLATASLDLTHALPRYTICRQLGPSALGAFAVAGGLMVAMSLIVGALSQAASPRLARLYAAGNIERFLALTGRLVLWVVAVGLASTIVMALAGKTVLYCLYGAHYAAFGHLAAFLMAIAGLRNLGIVVGRTLSSMRMFRWNFALRVVGLALLAAMLPGWVAAEGLWGAAWALGLSWSVTALLSMAVVLHAAGHKKSPRFSRVSLATILIRCRSF